VTHRIARRLPNTFLLALLALILALILASPAGLLSAVRPNRWFDRSSGLTFLLLYSLPSFWAALLLMQLFSVKLQILPLYGMTSPEYDQLPLLGKIADRIVHLVLPVITLAYAQLAIFARFSRSALLEVIHQDFIVAARAKGLSESAVVLRHAFRNALIPLITLLGFVIPYLISGSVIVEQLFQWDGVGKLFFQSVLDRDYPTIMGLTVLTAVFTLIANLAVDLLYRVADPRIRVEGRHA
jgi:peptide/nickel transport system permease protein